jgi:arylsulfatase A-like enzyme
MTRRASDLPDVVLVVFDTARRDRFGCYGYGRPTTPTTDSLAAAGTVAETMIANGPWTLPSHASLFTGLYPAEHGAQWQTGRRLNDRVQVTIAEVLEGAGYSTVCATNNALIGSGTGLARGFARHAHRSDLEGPWARRSRQVRKVVMGGDSGGEVINDWVREQVRTIRGPMFLFVNYLECHWPYAPPRALQRQVGGPRFDPLDDLRFRMTLAKRVGPWDAVGTADERALDVYSALYDAEHRNVDGHLEELLDILRSSPERRTRDPIVIVTSDHGEHIGEHGLADHQASLDDHLVRVPFVAWGPGVIPTERRKKTFEFVDVLPSLVRLLGLPEPVDYLADRRTDLFLGNGASDRDASGEADLAFAEWRAWAPEDLARVSARHPSYDFSGLVRDLVCVRSDRFKLVRSPGADRLFDLAEDPMEERDVSGLHPEESARLAAALDRRLASWSAFHGGSTGLSDEQSDEIERHLTELGYL